jgi:hypothetical protein
MRHLWLQVACADQHALYRLLKGSLERHQSVRIVLDKAPMAYVKRNVIRILGYPNHFLPEGMADTQFAFRGHSTESEPTWVLCPQNSRSGADCKYYC